jgi:IclR family transcriptional regulator, pca regulon regulatory protein
MARLRRSAAEKRLKSDFGPDFLEALARGLKVINAFDSDHRQMNLAEAARQVDLPKATVRRVLHTLASLGYVGTDGRQFSLTPKILKLASAYLVSNGTSAVLQPMCERICKELSEACSVAALHGDDVVMIAHASPRRFVSVGPGIGYHLPAFCTSLGRVLLAALPDSALGAYLKRLQPDVLTPHTVTDKRKLRELIGRAREQGFALVDQEAELGFRSISVPLRRHDGKTIAAINVGVRVESASIERMHEVFLPRLLKEAKVLSEQLIEHIPTV